MQTITSPPRTPPLLSGRTTNPPLFESESPPASTLLPLENSEQKLTRAHHLVVGSRGSLDGIPNDLALRYDFADAEAPKKLNSNAGACHGAPNGPCQRPRSRWMVSLFAWTTLLFRAVLCCLLGVGWRMLVTPDKTFKRRFLSRVWDAAGF